MRLAGLRSTYYEFSGKLSDNVRQLNFAGIAVVWIFRVGQDNGGIPFAPCLLWSMGFFVVSLGLDLLHYIYATLAWGLFHRVKEKQCISEDRDIRAPCQMNWPAIAFFWAKIASNLAGYVVLTRYIASQLLK